MDENDNGMIVKYRLMEGGRAMFSDHFMLHHHLSPLMTPLVHDSRHGRALHHGRAHLVEHSVQPLQWSVEMELDPTGRRSHRLAPILGSPAFDEAQADRAHPRQLVDSLETL